MTSEVEVLETLDGELWSILPEDVMLSILAWLPLKDLARYRTVCKKWKAMWQSPAFLHVRCRAPAEKSWFVFNRLERMSVRELRGDPPESPSLCYNPGLNKWHTSIFNHLPVSIDRVAATSGGLMFCVKRPIVHRVRIAIVLWRWPVMIVCNPLKENCCKTLPGRHCNWQPHTIGMIVDSQSNSYKIVLATVHHGTEIYDSSTNSWKLLESCRPPAMSYHPEAISHKGSLYSFGVDTMFMFDVNGEVWRSFDLPLPEKEVRNTQLYDCEGRLLMVGCLKAGDAPEEARMLVWERVGEFPVSGVWQELSSVSIQEVSIVFDPDVDGHGQHNDLLFVRGLTVIEEEDHTGGLTCSAILGSHEKAFLYSLSNNAWYLVDESRTHCQRTMKFQGDGLRFEPKIEASV